MPWSKKPEDVPAHKNSYDKDLKVLIKTDELGNETDIKYWPSDADSSKQNETSHAWKLNTPESGGRESDKL